MAQQPPPTNLIANPMGLPEGSFIITGGMYGSGQERILVHTGGLPSAPQPPQLSPVFILPTSPSQKVVSEGSEDAGLSLPSFGGSLEGGLSNGQKGGGGRTPLLSDKITRTPLPVIGGKNRCIMDACDQRRGTNGVGCC